MPPWHKVCTTVCQGGISAKHRVRTEKSIQNSHTFHKPLQYGAKKQHEGMQLCQTSGKGAQPLL